MLGNFPHIANAKDNSLYKYERTKIRNGQLEKRPVKSFQQDDHHPDKLTPDNIIYGTLISALQSKDWAAGMPYEENFKIQSITLKGAGIHRKICLLEGEDVNMLDYFIPRADCYYKGNFFIFGLPAGEFELLIRAQGYKPFVKKCLVKAGKQFDPMLVELAPE